MPGSSRSISDPRNLVCKDKTKQDASPSPSGKTKTKTKQKLTKEEVALLRQVVLEKYTQQKRAVLLKALQKEQAKIVLPKPDKTTEPGNDEDDEEDKYMTTTAGGRPHAHSPSYFVDMNDDDDHFDDESLSSHDSLYEDLNDPSWYVKTENRVITIYCETKDPQEAAAREQEEKARTLASAKALIDKVLQQHQRSNKSVATTKATDKTTFTKSLPRRSDSDLRRTVEKNVPLPGTSHLCKESYKIEKETTPRTTTSSSSVTDNTTKKKKVLDTTEPTKSKFKKATTIEKEQAQPLSQSIIKTTTKEQTTPVKPLQATGGMSTKERIALWNKMANNNNPQQ